MTVVVFAVGRLRCSNRDHRRLTNDGPQTTGAPCRYNRQDCSQAKLPELRLLVESIFRFLLLLGHRLAMS